MKTIEKNGLGLVLAMSLAAALAACGAAEPIDPDDISRADEIQARGGLLSKEAGGLSYEL